MFLSRGSWDKRGMDGWSYLLFSSDSWWFSKGIFPNSDNRFNVMSALFEAVVFSYSISRDSFGILLCCCRCKWCCSLLLFRLTGFDGEDWHWHWPGPESFGFLIRHFLFSWMSDLITVFFWQVLQIFCYQLRLESRTFAVYVLFVSIGSINDSSFNPRKKTRCCVIELFLKDLMKCTCALSRFGNGHRIHNWILIVKHVRLNISVTICDSLTFHCRSFGIKNNAERTNKGKIFSAFLAICGEQECQNEMDTLDKERDFERRKEREKSRRVFAKCSERKFEAARNAERRRDRYKKETARHTLCPRGLLLPPR